MAAVPLNRFKTIRAGITTQTVGIYTCPIGVSAVVLLAQATNLTDDTTAEVTAYHSRSLEAPSDFKIANGDNGSGNFSLFCIFEGFLSLRILLI